MGAPQKKSKTPLIVGVVAGPPPAARGALPPTVGSIADGASESP